MPDLLSASERDAIITPLLRQYLEPLGLSETAPRKWVDGTNPPIRRLFEMQLLVGAGLKACWGFSLDFVPHIGAGRVYWHRSNKKAIFDIIVDPRGLPQPSFLRGPDRLRADLALLLPQAIALAERDWSEATTYEKMLQLILSLESQKTNCFTGHYVQTHLTCAFLSAKIGDLPGAQNYLQKYLAQSPLDEEETRKLHELLPKTQNT